MTIKTVLSGAILALATLGLTPAVADVVLPVGFYNMQNGDGTGALGDYQYWDGTYTGSGNKTTDNAPLTGGTGVLTNGFKANDRWDYYSTKNGTGQYVGWNAMVYGDPTINFHLTGDPIVHSISFWIDNSYVGLVGGPASIVINGVVYNAASWIMAALVPNVGNAPGAEMITVNGLNISSQDIAITLNAGPKGADALAYQYDNLTGDKEPWLFLSEVQFTGVSAVPELSTWIMMLLGFVGTGYLAYRRRSAAVAAG